MTEKAIEKHKKMVNMNWLQVIDGFTWPEAIHRLLDIVLCDGGEREEAIESAKRDLTKMGYLDGDGKATKEAWELPTKIEMQVLYPPRPEVKP